MFFPVGLDQAGQGTTRIDFDDLAPEVRYALLDFNPAIAEGVAARTAGGPEVTVAVGEVPLREFHVKIEPTISDRAILLKDVGRKDLPTTTPSATLVALVIMLEPAKK